MNEQTRQRVTTPEFVALIAMLFSCVAFSLDTLLAAIPAIEAELHSPGQGYLVITMFVAGLALGTFVAGPLSDTFGRKNIILLGAGLYIAAGIIGWLADSFTLLIAARFVQGLGVAGPRVVSIAIVRDLYAGARMARIVSFAMVLFTIVPTFAPAFGALLSDFYGWRSIQLALIIFMLISTGWLWIRLGETLPSSARRPLQIQVLVRSAREILWHPIVSKAIIVQGLALGIIFSLLVQVQPIYDQVFDRAESFPYWFGGIALVSAATTSLANATLVVRFGMRRMVTLGMAGQAVVSGSALFMVEFFPHFSFPTFVVWQFLVIWMTGLTIGNLNAIALEPMGHIAGITTSLSGGLSTLIASVIAGIVGAIFNGTPAPLFLALLTVGLIGLILMGRLNATARVITDAEPKPVSPSY